jgi:6-phospho-3-hexuloisomerase
MKNIIETIGTEIKTVLENVSPEETKELADKLEKADRIFVAGTGRSGLVGKMFAMRMMHSEYPIYVVGETITPSIATNDLLLLISGSGSTGSLKQYGEKAKEIGAQVALVTTNKDSAIGKLSDVTVTIPSATKKRLPQEPTTIQPLGSQFDQSAHLLLDAIVVYLLENKPAGQDNTKLNQVHANLE